MKKKFILLIFKIFIILFVFMPKSFAEATCESFRQKLLKIEICLNYHSVIPKHFYDLGFDLQTTYNEKTQKFYDAKVKMVTC